MSYSDPKINKAYEALKKEFKSLKDKPAILRSSSLRELFGQIAKLPPEERSAYGKEVNQLKNEVTGWLDDLESEAELGSIDVTAPFDVNVKTEDRPKLISANIGTIHPLSRELQYISDIAYRMGFNIETSRQLDDDYHMFTSLNFPEDHPARDDYDTFITTDGLVAPAHTSTMQNRYMKKYKENLDKGLPIKVLIPDRVFRNEDLDATHEHTFYQHEGIYVDKNLNVGNLIATLRAFLSAYFQQDLKAKIQPFYFPFTEPSFEFAVERPDILKRNNSEDQKWLELGGCGMIHPNVLLEAGIDPKVYSGFAWGFGVERMVMMKYGIEDVRYFESAKLDFLRQFA